MESYHVINHRRVTRDLDQGTISDEVLECVISAPSLEEVKVK